MSASDEKQRHEPDCRNDSHNVMPVQARRPLGNMQGRGKLDRLCRVAQDADLYLGRQALAHECRRLIHRVIEPLRPAAGQDEPMIDGLLHVSLQKRSRVCLRSPPSRPFMTVRYWRVQEFRPSAGSTTPRIWHRLRTYSAEWERGKPPTLA